MKKSIRLLLQASNWALAAMLGMAGFTGCNPSNGSVSMYGVPWKSAAIKGKVLDHETKQPVPNIAVKLLWPDSLHPSAPDWAARTDASGAFKLTDVPLGDSLQLAVHDVDGDANGAYLSDTVSVSFDNQDTECVGCGNEWFEGELTKNVRIELKPKAE